MRGVSLSPGDARALDALGSLYYWYWLVVPLPADSAARLLLQAERTLTSAVTADPSRAAAWNLLSAILYERGDYGGAYLAESHAYEADAYLRDSEEILNGLFLAGYEIGNDSAAVWCDEIRRRFRNSWTGAYCQLALWAWTDEGRAAPVAQIWRTAADAAESSVQGQQVQPVLEMLVAAVLARHGLSDSAEAVIRRARRRGAGNPELLPLEADARIVLRQRDAAANLLAQYVRAKPLHRGESLGAAGSPSCVDAVSPSFRFAHQIGSTGERIVGRRCSRGTKSAAGRWMSACAVDSAVNQVALLICCNMWLTRRPCRGSRASAATRNSRMDGQDQRHPPQLRPDRHCRTSGSR